MLYAIMAHDVPDSVAKRAQTRERHLQYIRPLVDQGRIVLAGPNPAIDSPNPGPAGMSGSLIVAEFESIEAAQSWAENDPYYRAGVFQSVTVKPFLKVLP
jgi:uncharacterized protein YciI